jgi:hypothetical protein
MTTTTLTLPFGRPDPMEPPPAYGRPRDRTPIARVRQPAWLVTSYDAVAVVVPSFVPADPKGNEFCLLEPRPEPR